MNAKRIAIKTTFLFVALQSYDIWSGAFQIWMQQALVIPV